MPLSSKFREAIKENFNVLGLAGTAAVSAALLNPLPLLAGLVAEAAYLLFVPDSKWYDQRLSQRYDADVDRRREDLKRKTLPLLRPETQDRFARLERMRKDLERQPGSGEKWFREILRKLDFLLEKFLLFAAREVQFRTYLRSVLEELKDERDSPRRDNNGPLPTEGRQKGLEDQILGLFFPALVGDEHPMAQVQKKRRAEKEWPPPKAEPNLPRSLVDPWVKDTVAQIQAQYDGEIKSIQESLADEQDSDTKAVLQKRLEVIQRRQEFVGKMGKILINLNHQLGLLEDTFGLVSDEIRAHPPDQVLADIDEVVWQTNTMTQVLEQIAPYESSSMSMESQ